MPANVEQLAAAEIEAERHFVRPVGKAGPIEREAKASSIWMPALEDRFSLTELDEPPLPMKFVVEPYLPAGCAAILTGAGGTNKTGLMTAFAIHTCTGAELFASKVTEGAALYVSAEDRRAVLHRHVFANSRLLTYTQRELVTARLHVKDTVGLGFHLTRHIDGQTDVAADIGQLVEYCNGIPDLRLICLDTLSRLNGGEENNEDLARFIEAMERIARETGAAVVASHHSGKAQMRADTNDQYAGRGGSALSDNARSVMHITRLTTDSNGVPSNGTALIAEGRLLRLSHVKSNYATAAADRYLERIITPHAARLVEFEAEFGKEDMASIWERVAGWMANQAEVRYPTARTLDTLGGEFGSRAERRRAISWALDRGRLIEAPHPDPQGKRKTFYALPSAVLSASAAAYRSATDGD